MRYSATAETLVKTCVIFVSLYGTKQSHDFTLYRQFSTNEKARLCFSKKKKKYKSKHRPGDKKFSQQRTRSDRISNRFEALRHILKTFHEAYTFFFKWTAYRKPYWKCLVKYSAHFVAYFFFYLLNNALYRRDFGRFSR